MTASLHDNSIDPETLAGDDVGEQMGRCGEDRPKDFLESRTVFHRWGT